MKKGRLEIRISQQEKLFLMESSKRLGYTNISDFVMAVCKGDIEDFVFPVSLRSETELLSFFRATYPEITYLDDIKTEKIIKIEECLPFNFMKTEDNFYIFCPIGFYPVIFRVTKKIQYKIVQDSESLEEFLTLLAKPTKYSWAKKEAEYLHNYYANLLF
jgi:hypothetical protein